MAYSCARICRTPGKLGGTEREGATPRDASSSETNSKLSFQGPSFVVISVSPVQFRDQDTVSPRHPGIAVKGDRSAEPFDARINRSTAKNSDSTSFFSHVVGLEEVSGEVSDIDASKSMNSASNPVHGKTPKFVYLQLSDVNTADKLNIVFAPVTKAEVLTDHSNWFTSRHSISGVTASRVSEEKRTAIIIKILSLKL